MAKKIYEKILIRILLILVVLIFINMNSKSTEIQKIDKLPFSMKGYELYTWNEDGIDHYKLTSGTNREKSVENIVADEFKVDGISVSVMVASIEDLEEIFKKLPEGSIVILNDEKWWDKNSKKTINQSKNSDKILELTTNLNIQLIK